MTDELLPGEVSPIELLQQCVAALEELTASQSEEIEELREMIARLEAEFGSRLDAIDRDVSSLEGDVRALERKS